MRFFLIGEPSADPFQLTHSPSGAVFFKLGILKVGELQFPEFPSWLEASGSRSPPFLKWS